MEPRQVFLNTEEPKKINKGKNYEFTDKDYSENFSPGFQSGFKPVTGSIFGEEDFPCSNHVKQLNIGDCYFLAALKTIARRNPDVIKNMIEDLGDKVRIRLYYFDTIKKMPVPIYYTIDKTIIEHKFLKRFGHGAPWVYLMEKVYVLHLLLNPDFKKDKEAQQIKKSLKQKLNNLFFDKITYLDMSATLTTLLNKKIKVTDVDLLSYDELFLLKSAYKIEVQAPKAYEEILSGGSSDEVYRSLLACQSHVREIPKKYVSLLELVRFEAAPHQTLKNNKLLKKLNNNNINLAEYLPKAYFYLLTFKEKALAHDVESEKLAKRIEANQATANEIIQFFETFYPLNPNYPDQSKAFLELVTKEVKENYQAKVGQANYTVDSLDFYEWLSKCLRSGQLVTIATRNGIKESGFVPGHMYVVVNLSKNETTNHILLTLENPWGFYKREYEEVKKQVKEGDEMPSCKEGDVDLKPKKQLPPLPGFILKQFDKGNDEKRMVNTAPKHKRSHSLNNSIDLDHRYDMTSSDETLANAFMVELNDILVHCDLIYYTDIEKSIRFYNDSCEEITKKSEALSYSENKTVAELMVQKEVYLEIIDLLKLLNLNADLSPTSIKLQEKNKAMIQQIRKSSSFTTFREYQNYIKETWDSSKKEPSTPSLSFKRFDNNKDN